MSLETIKFSSGTDKVQVFSTVARELYAQKIEIDTASTQQSWGGLLHIYKDCLPRFIEQFYSEGLPFPIDDLGSAILIIAPKGLWSWQVDPGHRQFLKVVNGPVEMDSDLPVKLPKDFLVTGNVVSVEPGSINTLVGLNNWAILAMLENQTPGSLVNLSQIRRVKDKIG